MKDPTPNSNWQDTTEFERQLLEAARRDAAPAAMKAKMATALSALPPTAASSGLTASAASTATSATRLLFSHPALWGTLCLVIAAGAVRWQSSSPERPQHHDQQAAQLIAAAPPPAAESVAALDPPPTAAIPVDVQAAPTAPLTRASSPRIDTPRTSNLREELALLDSARSALAARDAGLALQLLDKHAGQFARGSLTPEAEALRIDAWAQRGESERVAKLSRRFLERHPAHPLAAHVASIAQTR